MSARILVVDDLDINLRLLEARLNAEYYEVVLARSGPEALAICQSEAIDLVLLDVMMPDMDGYEVCRLLKADPKTRHLPIVLVTALDQPSDRVMGLEAGADDFLTKPVRDLQLFSRVRSLTRLKLLTDELRVRAETTASVVSSGDLLGDLGRAGLGGRVMIFEDAGGMARRLGKILKDEQTVVEVPTSPDALASREAAGADLFVVDLASGDYDALRLCSQIRSRDSIRQIPILLITDAADEIRAAKAMELGANDYLIAPIDRNELRARVRTQVKRRRYDESLRQSLRQTIELAVTDGLTGLSNRRFLETHLPKLVERATADQRPLAVLIADIDHFKRINDGFGHDAGDHVLREFAARVKQSLRASDLACRFGGEEFVVLMPEADERAALGVAERIRVLTAEAPFAIGGEALNVTVSVGYANLGPGDSAETMLKRADQALYSAKRAGRNRVETRAA
ncbi:MULTISPECIES: PleD family two-component system response regulator [unclassified Aureimonas]|uniref:PleD family two-component system response regulator n=1 Tax=unclassified Aureimonas TaxID=2615206 RepID=UPI0006FF7E51|nr:MULTISPECIES: PleD family two-component system response regulator [unclassified Aureimonas]KQT60441.1 response regulator PleD [Aureimonas sp. Leaf427]KQT79319.1 response regulator PleD [Aureimonas sp. Leaf460]